MELHVLARAQLSLAAAVHVRDLADRAQLRRRRDPAGDLHAQHERPDLRLVVVEPPPLEPDDVLLVDLLVARRDQRRQLVEHPERALLALQALDRVPLQNELEGRRVLQHLANTTKNEVLASAILWEVKFCRIESLPPYVFATVDQLKRDLRRDGRDVVDLGFGNPDIASPAVAVEKLREAAEQAREPPLLGEPRHHTAPSRRRRALPARVRRHARPGDADREHDRRQGGSRPPDVGAGRARRHGRRPDTRVPDPSRRPGARRRDGRHAAGRRRRRRDRRRVRSAQTEGRDRLVPSQPDDRGRRPSTICSGSSTSRGSTTSCWCTTLRTPRSRSTGTSRNRSSPRTAPTTARSSSTA